ncbi:hypothetical protein C8R45DRAFT_1083235 [Mycena sanguinolenta]|nr:hypothetical protein C8R45DRAFT_1083235 [Mycena sanguinolenta]
MCLRNKFEEELLRSCTSGIEERWPCGYRGTMRWQERDNGKVASPAAVVHRRVARWGRQRNEGRAAANDWTFLTFLTCVAGAKLATVVRDKSERARKNVERAKRVAAAGQDGGKSERESAGKAVIELSRRKAPGMKLTTAGERSFGPVRSGGNHRHHQRLTVFCRFADDWCGAQGRRINYYASHVLWGHMVKMWTRLVAHVFGAAEIQVSGCWFLCEDIDAALVVCGLGLACKPRLGLGLTGLWFHFPQAKAQASGGGLAWPGLGLSPGLPSKFQSSFNDLRMT